MTDKYNMNIPGDIASFIERYINENPELGFKFISTYVIHLLREHVKSLTLDTKKEEKKFVLTSGEYSKEDLEKLIREN